MEYRKEEKEEEEKERTEQNSIGNSNSICVQKDRQTCLRINKTINIYILLSIIKSHQSGIE